MERFRLIYLKSNESERSAFDEFSSSHDLKEIARTPPVSPSPELNGAETFSSRTILKQVKTDLKHPDPRVRVFATQYLAKVTPSVAIPLLQEILSDRDPRVRAQAIVTLTRFRDATVFPSLKKGLKDGDPSVRMAALRGLFKNSGQVDLNLLLQFLSDESTWVRRKVATLLGWTQMEGVLPVLSELSKDQDATVRQAALLSLTTLYSEESEDRLVEAMGDPDPDLRKWAKNILQKRIAKPLKGRKGPLADRE